MLLWRRNDVVMTSFPQNQRFLVFSSYFCAEDQHSQKLMIKNPWSTRQYFRIYGEGVLLPQAQKLQESPGGIGLMKKCIVCLTYCDWQVQVPIIIIETNRLIALLPIKSFMRFVPTLGKLTK